MSSHGTTWFPVWQSDLKRFLLRPVIADLLRAFREADEDLDPLVIAAWATNANDFLDGMSRLSGSLTAVMMIGSSLQPGGPPPRWRREER